MSFSFSILCDTLSIYTWRQLAGMSAVKLSGYKHTKNIRQSHVLARFYHLNGVKTGLSREIQPVDGGEKGLEETGGDFLDDEKAHNQSDEGKGVISEIGCHGSDMNGCRGALAGATAPPLPRPT